MNIKIEGKIIILRKFRKSDAHDIVKNANHLEISKYTTVPYPYTIEHALDYIKKSQICLRKGTGFYFGIVPKENDQIIGTVSLEKIDVVAKKAEVGYWLGKKYWKLGIADEALKLILKFGFNKLELIRIWARVMEPNKPSIKLLEKNGFKLEGILRRNFYKHEQWYDELRFALLKDDTKAIQV